LLDHPLARIMTPERFKNPRPASADRVIRISIRKPRGRDCKHKMENDMRLSRTALFVTVASLAFAAVAAAPTRSYR
jgi:hypothetical protein